MSDAIRWEGVAFAYPERERTLAERLAASGSASAGARRRR